MTLKELVKLYRQCERDSWSDNPVTMDEFITWLEAKEYEN